MFSSWPLFIATLIYPSSYHPMSSIANTIVNKYHPIIGYFFLLWLLEDLPVLPSSFSTYVDAILLKLCSVPPPLSFPSPLIINDIHISVNLSSLHTHNPHPWWLQVCKIFILILLLTHKEHR